MGRGREMLGAFLSGLVLGMFTLAVVVVLTINARQTKGG
jgi:hypothetical protein